MMCLVTGGGGGITSEASPWDRAHWYGEGQYGFYDLSISKERCAEMKRTLGTVGYASPEMLKGEASSWEGDAFGAGVVLYFMLSKSTPFLAPTRKRMVELTEECHVKTSYSCFENLSDDCRTLMLQLLKKDVQDPFWPHPSGRPRAPRPAGDRRGATGVVGRSG
eukprot:g20408.t1